VTVPIVNGELFTPMTHTPHSIYTTQVSHVAHQHHAEPHHVGQGGGVESGRQRHQRINPLAMSQPLTLLDDCINIKGGGLTPHSRGRQPLLI
jgi:hypothetical protein